MLNSINKGSIGLKRFIGFACILLIALVGFFSFEIQKHFESERSKDLENYLLEAEQLIVVELNNYYHGLQGMAGVYTVTNYQPTLKQIHEYALSRQFFENFKGVFGFGFIRYVRDEDYSNYLKIVKNKINLTEIKK
jgi:CHASE1-domain containing sensor protein